LSIKNYCINIAKDYLRKYKQGGNTVWEIIMDKITDDRKPKTFMDASGEEIADKYIDVAIAGIKKKKPYAQAMKAYFRKIFLRFIIAVIVSFFIAVYFSRSFNDGVVIFASLSILAFAVTVLFILFRAQSDIERQFIQIHEEQRNEH
jgi:magnesium-transporting ATPase (P-type)